MQDIRNPILEFIIPLMREGGTSLCLLGAAHPGVLPGLGQYLLIGVLAALAFNGLPKARPRRLPGRWKAIAGGWAVCVIAGLLAVRTADRRTVHLYRAIVLNDAAWEINSSELTSAARRERAVADALRTTAR